MNAPGKGLLKVVSILFIIAGAFAVITSIFGAASSAMLAQLGIQSGTEIIAMIISVTMGILEIVFGILGIKQCAIPTQGQLFIVSGIVLCAMQVLNMSMHIIGSGGLMLFALPAGLLGFVLPALYIVGGVKNKKAVAS